jgi:DNA-binding NarL/FixJ family response regulator
MGALAPEDQSLATKIRVLLAEDQTMLRGALAALLELEPDITIVAQATNGREAFKLSRDLTPDIVVTDIEMPEMTASNSPPPSNKQKPNRAS